MNWDCYSAWSLHALLAYLAGKISEFNENIMGDDENLRDRFISVCIYLDNKN